MIRGRHWRAIVMPPRFIFRKPNIVRELDVETTKALRGHCSTKISYPTHYVERT